MMRHQGITSGMRERLLSYSVRFVFDHCKVYSFLMGYIYVKNIFRIFVTVTLLIFDVFQIDVEAEVQTALQSPPQGGCRELVTVLACSNVLCNVLNGPEISEVL